MKSIGKRFAGMILSSGLVGVGFFIGAPENFATFATTIGLLYTVYVGGQSATDWKAGTTTGTHA